MDMVDIRVRDLMTKNVVTLPCTATAFEAAKIITEKKVGCVVVTHDSKKLDGIITSKDLVKRVMAEGKDPKKIKLLDVMSRVVHSVSPDMHISEAVKLMGHHDVRRLPVVDGGKLVGIITDKNVIKAELGIAEVMSDLFTFREGG